MSPGLYHFQLTFKDFEPLWRTLPGTCHTVTGRLWIVQWTYNIYNNSFKINYIHHFYYYLIWSNFR